MTSEPILGLDVSRETAGKLKLYEELVRKWNPHVNLVSRATLDNFWSRHILDSLQLLRLFELESGRWADLGAGGGLPGLACAIAAAELFPKVSFCLVESDSRKAAFLQTVSRETSTSVVIINSRIEEIEHLGADIVSARALAPLDRLLGYIAPHLSLNGHALLMKGAKVEDELSVARKNWKFDLNRYSSLTNQDAAILKIGALQRV